MTFAVARSLDLVGLVETSQKGASDMTTFMRQCTDQLTSIHYSLRDLENAVNTRTDTRHSRA